MAYPLVAVPFIPQVLDCCLHFLRPDAKTLSDLGLCVCVMMGRLTIVVDV